MQLVGRYNLEESGIQVLSLVIILKDKYLVAQRLFDIKFKIVHKCVHVDVFIRFDGIA